MIHLCLPAKRMLSPWWSAGQETVRPEHQRIFCSSATKKGAALMAVPCGMA